MRALGRIPLAVVNNYFVEPRIRVTHNLLEGFEVIAPYERKHSEDMLERTRDVLASVGDRPFFLWLHVYNMHAPGYAGRLLSSADGSLSERYRLTLQWLDTHLMKLFDTFAEAGVDQNTIIVLASDHGEALGANGVKTHGPTAYQEEIRVPLQFFVPGQRGRVIDNMVSNVDILPTIFDLLGEPAETQHRGQSLVPLMAGKSVSWTRPYYVENGKGNYKQNRIAVIDGRHKLIYQPSSGVYLRFDLENDPKEDHNLYHAEGPVDRRLP